MAVNPYKEIECYTTVSADSAYNRTWAQFVFCSLLRLLFLIQAAAEFVFRNENDAMRSSQQLMRLLF